MPPQVLPPPPKMMPMTPYTGKLHVLSIKLLSLSLSIPLPGNTSLSLLFHLIFWTTVCKIHVLTLRGL